MHNADDVGFLARVESKTVPITRQAAQEPSSSHPRVAGESLEGIDTAILEKMDGGVYRRGKLKQVN